MRRKTKCMNTEGERARERESFILIFGRRKKLSDKVRTL